MFTLFKNKNRKELPNIIEYPKDIINFYYQIPLGISFNGEECWDLKKINNLLILGHAGSGKTVIQNSIIQHIIDNPGDFELLVINHGVSEFDKWGEFPEITITKNVDQTLDKVNKFYNELKTRLKLMKELKIKNINESNQYYKSIVIIIDDYSELCSKERVKDSDLEKIELNGKKDLIKEKLLYISNHNKGTNLYLSISSQRVSSEIINKEILHNCNFRILVGYLDNISSLIMFGNCNPYINDFEGNIKGRGIISRDGEQNLFQAYVL